MTTEMPEPEELDFQSVAPKILMMAPTETPQRPYAKLIGYLSYGEEDSDAGVLYITTRDDSTIAYHNVPEYMFDELKSSTSTYQYLQESGLWEHPYEYADINRPVTPAMLRYRRQKILGKEKYASMFGRTAKGVTKGLRRVGTPRYTSESPGKFEKKDT